MSRLWEELAILFPRLPIPSSWGYWHVGYGCDRDGSVEVDAGIRLSSGGE